MDRRRDEDKRKEEKVRKKEVMRREGKMQGSRRKVEEDWKKEEDYLVEGRMEERRRKEDSFEVGRQVEKMIDLNKEFHKEVLSYLDQVQIHQEWRKEGMPGMLD